MKRVWQFAPLDNFLNVSLCKFVRLAGSILLTRVEMAAARLDEIGGKWGGKKRLVGFFGELESFPRLSMTPVLAERAGCLA